jgi:hypothetical protein
MLVESNLDRRSTPVRRRCAAVLAFALLAAGGTGFGRQPTHPRPPTTSVAGEYTTKVALKRDDCGGVMVQDNPTVVTHDTANAIITLRHAGTTYGGKLAADSSFTTVPKEVNVNDGFVYTITIKGRFRASGFDAEATVDKASSTTKCRFVVTWSGTRG